MDDQLLGIGEASKSLGVSIDTLRRWEKIGKIPTYRSPGGHRYYKVADLDKSMNKKYERVSPKVQTPEVVVLDPKPQILPVAGDETTPPPTPTSISAPEITNKNQGANIEVTPDSDIKLPESVAAKPQNLKDVLVEEKKTTPVVRNRQDMSANTFLLLALIAFTLLDVVLIYFLVSAS